MAPRSHLTPVRLAARPSAVAAALAAARRAIAEPLRGPGSRPRRAVRRRELAALAVEPRQAVAALRAHLVALAGQRGRLRELLP
ncbi:hypothetical protein [Tepidiforma sp.]|uniref:hypothetical protein n=1 Tax=Tepidiforma sp. TaxID=2682230 RepID=UPI002ADE842D|nr:hypothetical protein [Tepidiforma sp.]